MLLGPDSIVADVLVLKSTRTSVTTMLTMSWFRVIWNILHYIDTVGPGIGMLQKSGKDPSALCLLGVSTKSGFCVAYSSWFHKRCNVIPGTLKSDSTFRCKRCPGLDIPVDNPMPSQDTVSHGANSMSSFPSSPYAHFPSPPEEESTYPCKRNLGPTSSA